MTDADLIRNLGIAKAQLEEVRKRVDTEARARLDAVLHVVVMVRHEIDRRRRGAPEEVVGDE